MGGKGVLFILGNRRSFFDTAGNEAINIIFKLSTIVGRPDGVVRVVVLEACTVVVPPFKSCPEGDLFFGPRHMSSLTAVPRRNDTARKSK